MENITQKEGQTRTKEQTDELKDRWWELNDKPAIDRTTSMQIPTI